MAKACGNPDCACSTGIHEGLMFGSGELSRNGYWSNPCHACARANDARQKESRASYARRLLAWGFTKRQIRRDVATADWLWLESWPFSQGV